MTRAGRLPVMPSRLPWRPSSVTALPPHVYRRTKVLLALGLLAMGIVRCPWGGGMAAAMGAAAGSALYMGMARRVPRARWAVLTRPGAWSHLLTAAADEVLWRGCLCGWPPRQTIVLCTTAVAGFALLHRARQGARGVLTHLITGAAFTAGALAAGLWAAAAAHAFYNLWVLMARLEPLDPDGQAALR